MPTDLLLASAATPSLVPAQVSTAQPNTAIQVGSNNQLKAIGLTLQLELKGDDSVPPGHLVAGTRANSAANFTLRFGLGDGDGSARPFGQSVRVAVFLVIRGQNGDVGGGSTVVIGDQPTSGGENGGPSGSSGPSNSGGSTASGTLAGSGSFIVPPVARPASVFSPTNSTAGTTSRLTLLDGTTTTFLTVPVLNRAGNTFSSVNGIGGEANNLADDNQSLSVNVVPRSGIPSLSAQVGGAAQQEEEDEEVLFEDLLPREQRREEKPDVQGKEDFAVAVPESQGVTLVSNFQAAAPGVLESALGEVMVEVKEAGGEVGAWLADYRMESWMAGLALAGSLLEVARRSQDEEEKVARKMANRRLDKPKDE